ncbi:Insulin gene enhancer protein ISL-1 [Eumeta japonica]|uniref:Insulin gene enhancer protein ISL-1 n=1 Tax=Eumeta variegata TaxID=151549 RepID=A0A4C1SMB7_EUMVA|nr:Insulin gene enhancer protein ISL-1 [Eumeta japonica]
MTTLSEPHPPVISLKASYTLPGVSVCVFYRLFGTKCDKCGASFSKNDFVMRAKTKIYHIDCFRCSACARQLIPDDIPTPRPLPIIRDSICCNILGDEFALREGGALYCREDHDVLEKSSSGGATGGGESNNNTTLSNNNSHHPHELGSMSEKKNTLSVTSLMSGVSYLSMRRDCGRSFLICQATPAPRALISPPDKRLPRPPRRAVCPRAHRPPDD